VPGPPGRGNGLYAAAYVPLADLDPQVADAVLEMLAADGIAAYASPANERSPGQIVAPHMDRVLDRLYVDSSARGRARSVLDDRLAELGTDVPGGPRPEDPSTDPPTDPRPDRDAGGRAGAGSAGGAGKSLDDDAAWAQIVAAFQGPSAADPVPRWPAGQDTSGAPPATSAPPGAPTRFPDEGGVGTSDGPGGSDGRGAPGESAAPGRADVPGDGGHSRAPLRRDGEDHFVPPPPPPLPRPDAVTRWAWAAVLGTPVFFFLVAVLSIRLGEGMVLLGVGAFVGGFVTLVARMKDRPPTDSGPDDGAVV
jgi:hypothetical protein